MEDWSEFADLPIFLNREELARVLRISLSSIDRALAKGQLEHIKIGRRILFNKEGVIKFLKLKKYQPEAKVVVSLQELEDRLDALKLVKEYRDTLPFLSKLEEIIFDPEKFRRLSEEKQEKWLGYYSVLKEKMNDLVKRADRLHERGIFQLKRITSGKQN